MAKVPGLQISTLACFLLSIFCYYCVLFLNHSPYFLSANNEQWLTHTVGHYLLKEAKANTEIIIVYLHWICPLNWTLAVERQNVSVAGAICTDHPKSHSHWVRSMVLPGLWRPNKREKWSQAALLKGASHGMSWEQGVYQWNSALGQVRRT